MKSIDRIQPDQNRKYSPYPELTLSVIYRTTHSLLNMHHSLYAVGGNDGNSSLNSVEIYKPSENKWTPGTSMQLRRGSLGAAVVEAISLEVVP